MPIVDVRTWQERALAYIEARVSEDPAGCWVTALKLDREGYCQVRAVGRNWMLHRLSYVVHVGPIPDGLVLDHLCRNRACCNPEHLEPVTVRENTLRSDNFVAHRARQTHCIHGHEFTEANTQIRPSGQRRCLTCHRDWNRAYQRRMSKKAVA